MADDTPVQDPAADDAETETSEPARVLPEHPALRSLFEQFEASTWITSSGQDVAMVEAADWRSFAAAAKDLGFEMCTDVTAVDYLGVRRTRYEVVAALISHTHNVRLRMRTALPADSLVLASLVPVYPGVNFFEREVYDMFGVHFEDHPDLTRILMPDDWVGHPLRKDFATGAVPVQFKESHKVT